MKAIRDDSGTPVFRQGGEVGVHSDIFEAFHLINVQLLKVTFQNLRFDLQNRLTGLSGDDLIKLQGKIDYSNELENFFSSLVK